MSGHFDPEKMTQQDLEQAIFATHDLEEPAPKNLSVDLLRQVIEMTKAANLQHKRNMRYNATLGWGITIGVMAERNRIDRLRKDGDTHSY